MKRWRIIYFSIFILSTFTASQGKKNMIDTIIATVNHARTYFDVAKEVTNLVSESLNFKTKDRTDMKSFQPENDHSFLKHSFVDGFFRMLKLDSSKVIAIAVNSVIFLAQLISTLFDMKANGVNPLGESESEPKTETNWDPLKFILENKNEKIQRLVREAQDPDLPNKLINSADGFELPCVRLLLCKISPIIRAAQKSLKNKSLFKNRQMTSWLPSWDEFEEYADDCESQHMDCNLFPE